VYQKSDPSLKRPRLLNSLFSTKIVAVIKLVARSAATHWLLWLLAQSYSLGGATVLQSSEKLLMFEQCLLFPL